MPFGGFHRQHVLAGHHHGLPDVEGSAGAQIIEAQIDIGAVALGRLHVPERAFRHQDFWRDLVRATQGETFPLEHPAHAGQKVIVAAAVSGDDLQQRSQTFEIEMQLPDRRSHQRAD